MGRHDKWDHVRVDESVSKHFSGMGHDITVLGLVMFLWDSKRTPPVHTSYRTSIWLCAYVHTGLFVTWSSFVVQIFQDNTPPPAAPLGPSRRLARGKKRLFCYDRSDCTPPSYSKPSNHVSLLHTLEQYQRRTLNDYVPGDFWFYGVWHVGSIQWLGAMFLRTHRVPLIVSPLQ